MKNLLLVQRLFAIFFMSCCLCSYAINSNEQKFNYPFCVKGSQLQLKRSVELQSLAKEDQKDRENWQNITEKGMMKVTYKDLTRHKRVAEIFAEGCFHDPKDYLAAAIIYQHGDTSDHYYQAFIWAKRAAELGELSGKSFSALAIDRYLVSIGKKQLFGSQYQKLSPNSCYCMQPVEQSFPDAFRKEYSSRSLDENYKIMASLNATSCPNIECSTILQPTPKGSIVGLW